MDKEYLLKDISTIDLLALSSDQLLLILKNSVLLHNTSYLKEVVNGTEPSPSVSSLLQLLKLDRGKPTSEILMKTPRLFWPTSK
jgi:hypothetical protein